MVQLNQTKIFNHGMNQSTFLEIGIDNSHMANWTLICAIEIKMKNYRYNFHSATLESHATLSVLEFCYQLRMKEN